MTFEIFSMQWDASEDAPKINYDDPRTIKPWSMDGSVPRKLEQRFFDLTDGTIPIAPGIEPIEIALWTFDGRGANWDTLYNVGKMGIWSERVFLELAKYANGALGGLPVTLDKRPFVLPVRQKSIGCLDRGRSEIDFFPHDPTKVMWIRKHAFHCDQLTDPLVFCIPESPVDLLVTSKVKQAVEELDPVGIMFKLLQICQE